MRGMSDFGQMHYEWMRAVSASGGDPTQAHYPPIEMTYEEFLALVRNYFSMKPQTIFGHPVRIVLEPVTTIPLPDRAW